MKTKLAFFAFFFSCISLCCQERYFVNATNGLNVRENASTDASRIGKIFYGALVTIVEETTVTYEVNEESGTFQSQWVKVKYDSSPYLYKKERLYEWNNTGYVVKYYLQKLDKANIKRREIDSTMFYKLYKEPTPYNPVKFNSLEEVKKTLSHKVKWGATSMFEGEKVLDKIFLPSGQTLHINEEAIDFAFVAYYPSEEILLFEGGHSSDFSISIQTGEMLETVGNPEYIMHSPSAKFRLNGFFSGHECSTYFFQEKTAGGYTYLTEFDDDVCYFNKFCWINEGDFIYSYNDNTKDGKEKYVLASLTKETVENLIPNTFKSPLRPSETLELGKVYKDTVNYIDFNEYDYDDQLFSVEKNKNTTILIYNKDVKTQLVEGDKIEISWKIDGLIPAGDPTYLDFREHLVSYDIVSPFKLKEKNVKALWRETKYKESLETEGSSIVLNQAYINTISDAEKAALAYVATFIGNECEWDGRVNEDRSNLKCKILSSLDLGYQCSDTHYGFLKRWFAHDDNVLKTLEICRTIPNTATKQSTFDEILIQTNAQNQTIKIHYKVVLSNIREGSVSTYSKTDWFKYNFGNLVLIDSERTDTQSDENAVENTEKTFVVSCGSGCAMTYTEHEIISNVDTNQVTFKVILYVNEVQNDEYFETYVFNCDSANQEQQIEFKENDRSTKTDDLDPQLKKQLEPYKNLFCK